MKTLNIFYIFVLITSLLTLLNNISNLFVLSSLVSIIGIISGILFFLNNYKFYYLAIVWIVAQIPFISSSDFILDLSQFFQFHISLNFGNSSFGFNLQILLLFLVKQISLGQFINQRISIRPYTEMSKLDSSQIISFVPSDIIAKKLISKTEVVIGNETYHKIVFEPIESERIKKAAITLISGNEMNKIKDTVVYSFTKE